MITFDNSGGIRWLKSRGVANLDFKSLGNKLPCTTKYSVEKDTGKKTSIVKAIVGILSQHTKEIIIHISGWGTWPSCENMALYESFVKSRGENRMLNEAPYHVFHIPIDCASAECLLDIILYFYWDAVLLDTYNNTAISFSNDETIWIHSLPNSDLAKILVEEFKRHRWNCYAPN